MATIRLRFVTTGDWVCFLIRLTTWSEFSHVEFLLDNGTTLGAHAQGGVRIRPQNYDRFTRIQIVEVEVTEPEKAAILKFAHAQVGKGYDFLDIFGIFFHRDWRDDRRWICSELVAAAFESGRVPLLNAPGLAVRPYTAAGMQIANLGEVNRVTPGGLFQSAYFIPAGLRRRNRLP